MHLARRGTPGHHALGGCLLDLHRLHMMNFTLRRCFRYMNGATAEHRPACCSRRQFCQCHPNRHNRFSRSSLEKRTNRSGLTPCFAFLTGRSTQMGWVRAMTLTLFRNVNLTENGTGPPGRLTLCQFGTEWSRYLSRSATRRAQSPESNSPGICPVGGVRPRCCHPRSFRQRPRAVRAIRPSWIR